jgi:hypothetical protein
MLRELQLYYYTLGQGFWVRFHVHPKGQVISDDTKRIFMAFLDVRTVSTSPEITFPLSLWVPTVVPIGGMVCVIDAYEAAEKESGPTSFSMRWYKYV